LRAGLGPGQQHRPGGGDLGEEHGGAGGPVQQDQHPRAQQVQQPPGQPDFVALGHRADGCPQQSAGAGLGQRHHPQGRVAGHAQPVADLPQPPPVPVSAGDLQGVQPVEGHGAQPGEPHAGRVRLGQRPGHHLKQGFQRRGPKTAAQVLQRLLRQAQQAQPGQPRGQLAPDPQIAKAREHPQRQDKVHPGPGRQSPQPALHRPGLLQDVIDQPGRQVLS